MCRNKGRKDVRVQTAFPFAYVSTYYRVFIQDLGLTLSNHPFYSLLDLY